MAVVRKRYWSFVGYPESLPDDWLKKLQNTGLPFAVSPLHDKDVNPDGEIKKAHYHFILCYSGPTSLSAVKVLTDSLKSPNPQYLESVKGMYRYFTHKDNPEKYQYDEKDIFHGNGFSPSDFFDLSKNEVLQIKKNIQEFIRNMDITEYCDLLDFLYDNDMSSEYDVACNNTIFFNTYIKSRRFKKQKEDSEKISKSSNCK